MLVLPPVHPSGDLSLLSKVYEDSSGDLLLIILSSVHLSCDPAKLGLGSPPLSDLDQLIRLDDLSLFELLEDDRLLFLSFLSRLDDLDLIEILDNDRLLLPSILSWLEYDADLFELLEDDLLLYLWLDDNEIIEFLDDDLLVSL